MIEGGEIIQEDIEVAKVCSNFFSNTVKDLDVYIPSEYLENDSIVSYDPIDEIINKYANHPSIKSITENIVKGDFSFNTVTRHDVEMVITSLDSKKASTRNSIPSRVLKENINICCEPLTNIINFEITNSSSDSCLKRADVAPIHNAEETTNKNNYRNVSLLSTLSKIFEKPLQPQIITFVENKLSPYLCGYGKGYSAQHALLSMLEKWKVFLDKGGDTLDHNLLVAKLHAYGFSNNALRLIKSYLSDRWQRVKINNSFSTWSALLVGVPQGSVFGPLLFNL